MKRLSLFFISLLLLAVSVPAVAQLPAVTDSAEAVVAMSDTAMLEDQPGESDAVADAPVMGTTYHYTFQGDFDDLMEAAEASDFFPGEAFPHFLSLLRWFTVPFPILDLAFGADGLQSLLRPSHLLLALLPILLGCWLLRREGKMHGNTPLPWTEFYVYRNWRYHVQWGMYIAAVGVFLLQFQLMLCGALLMLWMGLKFLRRSF